MESNAFAIMRLCGWAVQVLPHQAAGHLAPLVPQPQLPRARGALPSCLFVHPDTSAVYCRRRSTAVTRHVRVLSTFMQVREPRVVLKEFGTELPEGVAVHVHDSTADLRWDGIPQCTVIAGAKTGGPHKSLCMPGVVCREVERMMTHSRL